MVFIYLVFYYRIIPKTNKIFILYKNNKTMASGLTHILLTKKLQDEIEDGKLRDILAFGASSFQVGAVAPDLPYASIADNNFFANESPLADDFHYRKTNQIPLQSLEILKSLNGQMDKRIHYQMFSFFIGYISHVIADGTIHPFVRDKVGEYDENQAEHRSLEMQLDVLFVEELTKNSGFTAELNNINIHDQILDFIDNDASSDIIQIFSELIESTYHVQYSAEKIFGWIKGLYRMFEVAEGNHPKFYRVLESNSFTYRNRSDIDRERAVVLERPKDRDENFLKEENIDYFKDCIPQFYIKFIDIARKAYYYVYKDGAILDENDIPPINLDTGRLADNNDLNLIPEFWKI